VFGLRNFDVSYMASTLDLHFAIFMLIVEHLSGNSFLGADTVTLVTFATDAKDPRLQLMLQTAREHGWGRFSIIEDPSFSPPPWTVRTQRYKELVDSAQSDLQVFLFVDAYDVLVMGSPAELLRNYTANYGLGSVVYSCCKYNWPEVCPAWDAPPRCPWGSGCNDSEDGRGCHWANGGVFMGTAGSLQALFAMNPMDMEGPLGDDQCWANSVFSDGTFPELYLDANRSLFYGTLWDMSNNCNIRVSATGRFQSINDDNEPIIIHLDGGHPTFDTLKNFNDFRRAVGVGNAVCYQFPRWDDEPDSQLPFALEQPGYLAPFVSVWQGLREKLPSWLGLRLDHDAEKDGGTFNFEV